MDQPLSSITETWRQSLTRAHTFNVEGLRESLRVVRFDGQEGISRPFRFDITAVSETGDLAFPEVVGQRAELRLPVGDESRCIQGIVESFEQHDEGKAFTAYRAMLVPEVQRLDYCRNSRIFQALSVPEILEKVLSAAGIAGDTFRFALRERYPKRDYCVQYRESDWAFLSRLMEAEGIHYFFEHAEGRHVLVVADAASAHQAITGGGALPYRPGLGALAGGEHISRFRYAERVRPTKVTARDYNFKRPSLSLETSEHVDGEHDIEHYDFPGAYETPEVGASLARVRLEELQRTRRSADGDSNCPRLVPGGTFRLVDHPRDDFNQEYLITLIKHQGRSPALEGSGASEDAVYSNWFEVTPASAPFRPARETRRPVIQGVQTAIVVGPAGQPIYTDEHGRVRVQFHWDRHGRKDEHSSCWIRVSQAWAGSGFGAMFLPRVGHEVVVDFLEGDPDRPLIIGCLYHGANTPPYPLPAQKTKSAVRSSSVGGEGFNELLFDDASGGEVLSLRAQRDLVETVLNDRRSTISGSSIATIGAERQVQVHGDERLEVRGSNTVRVQGSAVQSCGGDSVSLCAGGRQVEVGGDDLTRVAGGHTVMATRYSHTLIGQGAEEGHGLVYVNGDYRIAAAQEVQLSAAKRITLVCGESSIELGPKEITLTAPTLTLKAAALSCATDDNALRMGKTVEIKGDEIRLFSKDASMIMDEDAKIDGRLVKLNCEKRTPQPRKDDADPEERGTITFHVEPHIQNDDGVPLTLVIATPDGKTVEKQAGDDGKVTLEGKKGDRYLLVDVRKGKQSLSKRPS